MARRKSKDTPGRYLLDVRLLRERILHGIAPWVSSLTSRLIA